MARRILTVDDSSTVRQALGMTLRDAGYEVLEAEDGEEALRLFEAHEAIDMLVTDLNMPNLNGLGLIEKVRKLPGWRFLPIIMLTTESKQSLKDEGKRVGASGWLTKPFKPEQVLGVVRMVMP
ncbi:MAG: two-component system response regulator [Desulfuromonas sp.]|nr:MAG: two-component system response regulator [Desulfuromonas sp.]